MQTQSTRRNNLKKLAEQWGGPSKLAHKLGYSNASFLTQMAGPNPTREITERTARKAEIALNLPENWLDVEHGAGPSDDVDIVKLVRLAAIIIEEEGISIKPTKFAEIIAVAYKQMVASGNLAEDQLRMLVVLFK